MGLTGIGVRGVGLVAWSLTFAAVSPATAMADSAKVCAEAYEKAQEERKVGHISAAIEHLTKCAAQDCPSFVRKDCLQWMTDAESAQPSIVFSVRRDGADLTAVEITVDGNLLTKAIDGKAIAVDPGSHLFTFRSPDGASVERSFIVREGERNRIVEIELGESPHAKAASPSVGAVGQPGGLARDDLAVSTPDRPWLSYSLAGLGALGVSGFAVFGLWGYSQKKDLERSCSPFCQSSQVDEVRTKYIVADVFLAVGLVSLGVAAYRFVRGREEPAKAHGTQATATLLPTLSGQGGAVDVAITF
jgi:hypothetical protein